MKEPNACLAASACSRGTDATSRRSVEPCEDDCDPFYFGLVRPEILALIPQSARRVLDIGCGAGCLGEALKARQHVEVVGIELVEEAARAARRRLDEVLIGNVERMELPFEPGSFDAIVAADVLEHLEAPERLVTHARNWLRPGGRLIVSVPNVRHHSVVRGLLDGNWTYESAGLLDRDHVRFFTRRSLEGLFHSSGFAIEELQAVPGSGFQEWEKLGRPAEIKNGRLHLQGLAATDAEEFFIYQYLAVAVPTATKVSTVGESMRNGMTQVKPQPAVEARRAGRSAEMLSQPRRLRILYLGNFGITWSDETYVASALMDQGHEVWRRDERSVASPAALLADLNSGELDCFLFSKGRIGARTNTEQLSPTGEAIAEVIRQAKVPCYSWYFDRAFEYAVDPSREAWMRRVAPLCRTVFTTEEALSRTAWARWHLLRLGVAQHTVQPVFVRDERREDIGFLGQVYGERANELARVEREFHVHRVQKVHGSDLSRAIRRFKIVLGPRFPSVPGYWSNRIYLVLGHGGFFLAPEVEGMHEEGFIPGVHYAALGRDAVADIGHWLARPKERERIAKAGQDLVLSRFTMSHRVAELTRVIAETLS